MAARTATGRVVAISPGDAVTRASPSTSERLQHESRGVCGASSATTRCVKDCALSIAYRLKVASDTAATFSLSAGLPHRGTPPRTRNACNRSLFTIALDGPFDLLVGEGKASGEVQHLRERKRGVTLE
jgi:hypothetical protein